MSSPVKTKRQDFKRFGAFKGLVEQKNVRVINYYFLQLSKNVTFLHRY
jgi:hypothetical protein